MMALLSSAWNHTRRHQNTMRPWQTQGSRKQEVCARSAWVSFCLSKGRHQVGRRAGTVHRSCQRQPKKQAALIRGKSKFGLRVSEDSIMWSWWEERMSRWHIMGTPYHFIWKGRRERISCQDLMEWEKKLMAPKSILSHMGANYKWVPGNVSSLGAGDTAPAVVSLAGTVDTEEKIFKLRTL